MVSEKKYFEFVNNLKKKLFFFLNFYSLILLVNIITLYPSFWLLSCEHFYWSFVVGPLSLTILYSPEDYLNISLFSIVLRISPRFSSRNFKLPLKIVKNNSFRTYRPTINKIFEICQLQEQFIEWDFHCINTNDKLKLDGLLSIL